MRPPHDPRPAAELVEHYAPPLRAARRHYPSLPDPALEDVVQEAFERVLRRMRRGPLEHPLSYLLRVVYTTGAHVVQDPYRRVLPLKEDYDDDDTVALAVDRSLTPLSPEEHVLSRLDCAEAWRVLLDDLTADERRALALRMVQERTPTEIAAAFGITERRYRRLRERGGRKLADGIARVREVDEPEAGRAADEETREAA